MLEVMCGTHQERIGPLIRDKASSLLVEVGSAPPPLRRPPTNSEKELSTRDEEEIARLIGGKRHKGSGNYAHLKGDGRKRGVLRFESKTTKGRQFHVELSDLNKIRQECSAGEKPAFIISFRERQTKRLLDRWVLTPFEDWHEVHNHK